jgi:hypothetical protein
LSVFLRFYLVVYDLILIKFVHRTTYLLVIIPSNSTLFQSQIIEILLFYDRCGQSQKLEKQDADTKKAGDKRKDDHEWNLSIS